MRTPLLLAASIAAVLLAPATPRAHCQVPCGIYDDAARIAQMREDSVTIAKAITSLGELAGKNDAQSWNQAVRWTTTKEDHASNIIRVASEYFLTQKVKPVAAGADGYDAYVASVTELHAVMRAAMVAKQTASAESVQALDAAIDKLAARWGEHGH